MECPQCQQSYTDQEETHLPRILTYCGHSICSSCLKKLFVNEKVECPICNQTSKAEQIQMFTKNLALLQIMNDNGSSFNKNINLSSSGIVLSASLGKCNKDFSNGPNAFDSISCYSQDSLGRNAEENSQNNININNSQLCKDHLKVIEAFCWNEKLPLCIDCLLGSQIHKSHDVLNIQNSIDKQKTINKQISLKVDCQTHKLKSNIKTLENQFEDLDKTQVKQISEVKTFFQQIKEIIDKRESQLISEIEEHSQTQSQQIDQKRGTLKNIVNDLSIIQKEQNDENSQIMTNNLDCLQILLTNESKANQVLKRIDCINRTSKIVIHEEFDKNKEIFNLNKQFQSLKANTTTNHQKNSSFVNLTNLQQQQPLPSCSNPFRAQQQPRDVSQKLNSNKKQINDKQSAQKELQNKKDVSTLRKSFNNSQMKEIATPQNNQRANAIPLKQQTVKEKELKDKTRQSFSKAQDQNKGITPGKVIPQKQNKDYSNIKGNQRCSSIIQFTDLKDEQLINTKQWLEVKTYLNQDELLNSVHNEPLDIQTQMRKQNKQQLVTLKDIFASRELDYNSTNIVTQKQALPKTFKHLSSKTTSRFIVKKDEQDQVQPFSNTTNLEESTAKVKNSSQIFKDSLRRPSLREMRNTAKCEKQMSNACQQEEKEWAEKQQRKVESISLARQMSSRQSLNKVNRNDLDNEGNDQQSSLTQRFVDTEEQVMTLENIKVEQQKPNKPKEDGMIRGIGIIGGIGDAHVAVDVYDPIDNKWVGKYNVYNQKREGYKAVNHPKNKQKIYFIGGKQNGKFIQKIQEYDIKSGKVFQADIKDLIHNYGDQFFTCCSGIIKNNRKVLIVSGSQIGAQVIISMYDFGDKKWIDLSKVGPQSLSDYQILIHKNQLYIFGGHCDGVVSKVSYRYSFEQNKWDNLPDMIEGRVYFGIVAKDDHSIMLIGGYDGEKVLSNCEVFDINKGQWTKCSYINSKRINHTATNYQGSVLVFGGVDDNDEIISQIEKYDSETQTWTIISPATLPTVMNPENKSFQQASGQQIVSQLSSSQLTFGKRFCHSLVNVEQPY